MGQYAVALVTMNRAKNDPDKVCQVVLAHKQFSWTTHLVKGKQLVPHAYPTDEDAWKRAQIIANVTLSGRMSDVTKGSTFYHTNKVQPYWTKAMTKVKTFGAHVFYRQDRYVSSDVY